MSKSDKKTAIVAKVDANKDVSCAVTKKAFELYVRRGKRSGHALDDWLEAERLIKHKVRF